MHVLLQWETGAWTDVQSIDAMLSAKLIKLFPEIVRSLYDQDVLAEDTILHWFQKGTNTKGRYAIVVGIHCLFG